MKFKKWKDSRWFPYAVAGCITVIVAFLLMHLGTIAHGLTVFFKVCTPVIIGIVIAYVLDPVVVLFSNTLFKKMKRPRMPSIILTVVLVLTGIVILVIALIPQLVSSIIGITGRLDYYETTLTNWLSTLTIDVDFVLEAITSLREKLDKLLPMFTDTIATNYKNVGSIVINIVLGAILSLYFLVEKAIVLRWFKTLFQKLIKPNAYGTMTRFCKRCNEILKLYVTFSIVEAIFVGAACAILMLIFRMPYVALIAVIVGITNLAPTFGPIVGAAIGCILLVLENPFYALYFLIFIIVIQLIDGYVFKPKMFGATMGVSSLWILVVIIVGGNLFGIIGVLLAIPFASIVQILLRDFLFPLTSKSKQNQDSNQES